MIGNVVRGTAGVVAASALGVGIFVGIPVTVYYLNYKTAHVRGTVQISNQNQDATNRIAAEGTWNLSNTAVLTDMSNLAMVKQTYAASDPQGFIISAKEACDIDVNSYNALHSEPLMTDWKPASLPLTYPLSKCN